MSFIIQNESDLLKFTNWVKLNEKYDIVYVYCKSFLDVYYVGYTSQLGIKKINYLNKHRIIPGFKKVFADQNKIIIYLNYNEDALITFFKLEILLYSKVNTVFFKFEGTPFGLRSLIR